MANVRIKDLTDGAADLDAADYIIFDSVTDGTRKAQVSDLADVVLEDGLQSAYDRGTEIEIVAEPVLLTATTDTSVALAIQRTFPGTGSALSVFVAALSTGAAVDITSTGGGAGVAIASAGIAVDITKPQQDSTAIRIRAEDDPEAELTLGFAGLVFYSSDAIIVPFKIGGSFQPVVGGVGRSVVMIPDQGGDGDVGTVAGEGGSVAVTGGASGVDGGAGSGPGGNVVISGGESVVAAGGNVAILGGDGAPLGNVQVGTSYTANVYIGGDALAADPLETAFLRADQVTLQGFQIADGAVVIEATNASSSIQIKHEGATVVEVAEGVSMVFPSVGQLNVNIDGGDILTVRDDGISVESLDPMDDGSQILGSNNKRWLEVHGMSVYAAAIALGEENDAGPVNLTKWQTTTTNATPTALASVLLEEGNVYWFEAKVIGVKNDETQRAFYIRATRAHRLSGGFAILGTIQTPTTDESDAAWDCTFTVTGASGIVSLSVTGVAATTINWKCFLTYQAVSA
jgi:hypothetical protein